jgi:CheY-like chemotaxis protein
MDFSPPAILVVEDNEDDQQFIRRALRAAPTPATVTTVRDGDEAIAYFSGDTPFEDRLRYPVPSIVLLDLKLPRRTGLEVLRWMREHALTASLPVIVLSSSEGQAELNRAYELGVSTYLIKPEGFRHLLATVWGTLPPARTA